MYAALCSNLKDSSELIHAICKGEEPTPGITLHLAVLSLMHNDFSNVEQNVCANNR